MARALIIRTGSVIVRIFVSRSGPYTRHELRWTDHHGKRRRLKRSSRPAAIKEARGIGKDLAAGHHRSELSLADLASFRAGVLNLVGTGKTLELATAEYAEVMRNLATLTPAWVGATVSLNDLFAFYREHRPTTLIDLTIPAAVLRLIETKTQQGISARWLGAIKSQLNRFKTDQAGLVSGLTAAKVRQWCYGLNIGARSKNNHLAAVKLLFSLAELRPHRERQAILDIKPIVEATPSNALWQPAEFQRLLHKAPDHLLPVLVLGGFAKMRSSEIMRVDWSSLRLNEGRILLHAGQTKTRRWRIVPLPECAVAWLRLVAKSDGKVWPWASQKFNADLRALAEGCKLKWRRNALRNSAVTYDQIARPDVARVAREAGNSASVLETEYFALSGVSKETAEEWFAILPPRERTRVIVPMEASK